MAEKLFGLRMKAGASSYVDNVEEVRKALHEEIEIKCFYEGTSTLLIDAKTVSVAAGDVVVINPYEFHATVDRGGEDSQGKYHIFMVPLDFFSGVSLPELDLRTLIFGQRKLFCNLFQDAHLHSLFMEAAGEYQRQEPAWQVRLYGLLLAAFGRLLSGGMTQTADSSDTLRGYRRIEPALRHIRDRYMESMSVEELAARCGVSKHYFCRAFKTAMDKTAMEYLQDYRMTIADVMLGNTDQSVAAVAAACGFESANYFGRCYKRRFGISPGKRRSGKQII